MTLKTEAHYILLVITSEFPPHLLVETVANGSAAYFVCITTGLSYCELYFGVLFIQPSPGKSM